MTSTWSFVWEPERRRVWKVQKRWESKLPLRNTDRIDTKSLNMHAFWPVASSSVNIRSCNGFLRSLSWLPRKRRKGRDQVTKALRERFLCTVALRLVKNVWNKEKRSGKTFFRTPWLCINPLPFSFLNQTTARGFPPQNARAAWYTSSSRCALSTRREFPLMWHFDFGN